MASLKAIRRRIASVKSTQQITRAMKLVSAAKLRRAQEALLNSRPYSESLAQIAASVLAGQRAALGPRENAKPISLIIVITSDRGLAGGYNANLLRKAEEVGVQAKAEGLEPVFFAVGRKALEHFKRGAATLAGERVNNLPRLANFSLAQALAQEMLGQYLAGRCARAGLVYSRFRSALSQIPTYQQVLPVDVPEQEAEPVEYVIEPSRGELLPLVTRSYAESTAFHALLEAEASEHAARMTAMDAATSNASDMIERLTLEMNRARQATITRELMDIVGGAEALRG